VDQAPTDAGRLAELAAAHLQIAAILEKKPEQIPLAAHHRTTAAGLFERQLEALRPTGLDTFPAICAGEQLAVLAARDPSVPRAQAVARALDLFRDLLARTEAYCAREENQSLEGPRRKLGDLHGAIATLLMETGALDEAGEHLRLALACWERFQRRQPDHIEWRLHAANTHARLADVAVARQDFGEADREFGTAIQGLEECWRLAPSNPFARQSLVTARYRRAHLLALTDRAAEALEELENCREHLDYVETLPDQGDLIQRHLIELERLTGTVLSRLGRNEEAIDAYSRALDRAGRLNGKTGGTDEALRAQTSETEGWLGIACISADKLGEAAVFLNHRRDFCEDQLRRDPGNALWRYGLGSALANLSIVQARSGDDTAAAALHREAITVLEPLTSQSPPFQLALRDLANEHNALAIHLHQHHDRAGAIRHGSRAIEVMETLIASAPGFPVYASHLQTFRTNLEIYSAA
jgi:tetratricopeptide (TPR) repeat protein